MSCQKTASLWHFRNEESITISNPLKKKSTFNPKGKDAAIEPYAAIKQVGRGGYGN